MKKILLFIAVFCAGIGFANAAGRGDASTTRIAVNTRNTVTRTNSSTKESHQNTRTNNSNTVVRKANNNTVSRATSTRSADSSQKSARSATTVSRSSAAVSRAASQPVITARGAKTGSASANIVSVSRSARTATAARAASNTQTFGSGYNTCRDAYFTCMDQFCAKQNESYRRCICSSRLDEIKSRERALGQVADSLQDFKDLNIDVIPKTAAEVKAMLTATAGESAASNKRDKSAAASQLAGIRDVLSKTKQTALSTQGTLDIAGDINAIWATTELTGGANIANLSGEALYNAVHAQCAEIMSEYCPSSATQTMVISAYGMYIENDCSLLLNSLDKKAVAANSAIRETEREMQTARLDNYNAHNDASIIECIASVRADITADTACGKNFVHCLDFSGRYLSRDTGAPIYTPDFYQLETQISLSGDILNNQFNRMTVAGLQSKRKFAENSLKTCTDIADEVWNEFMRQTIREIYQGQQERIRQVKDECLDVVNQCYDTQNQSLKDFSNVKEQLLLGQRLELAEEMCKDKLNACSNLYNTNGDWSLLVQVMHNITDQKIEKECRTALQEYAAELCAVPSNDILHGYPYGCRTYTPGTQTYATQGVCNSTFDPNELIQTGGSSQQKAPGNTNGTAGYTCDPAPTYISCIKGYYLSNCGEDKEKWPGSIISNPQAPNSCKPCPTGYICDGGQKCPYKFEELRQNECGDYVGSLYQKMVRYALNACVRPSNLDSLTNSNSMVLPKTVLSDVNVVMDQIRSDMSKELAAECDRLGGVWVSYNWEDTFGPAGADGSVTDTPDGVHDKKISNDVKYKPFYDETGANDKWGYCAKPNAENSVNIADADSGAGTTNKAPAKPGNSSGTGSSGTVSHVRDHCYGQKTWTSDSVTPTNQEECSGWVPGSVYTPDMPLVITINMTGENDDWWLEDLGFFEQYDNAEYVAPTCKCPDGQKAHAYATEENYNDKTCIWHSYLYPDGTWEHLPFMNKIECVPR